jgi:hypothetical protein
MIATSTACRQGLSTPLYQPTPTPGIRHRDALPLMPTLDDLGPGYAVLDDRRLEPGPGWSDRATRLSGYRTTYTGPGSPFVEVLYQVECYLSNSDAQAAYRTYKDELTTAISEDERYSSVDASEASLGEWGWMYRMQGEKSDRVHYLFQRGNVLVEAVYAGVPSPDFLDEAIRLAQNIDRRISAP